MTIHPIEPTERPRERARQHERPSTPRTARRGRFARILEAEMDTQEEVSERIGDKLHSIGPREILRRLDERDRLREALELINRQTPDSAWTHKRCMDALEHISMTAQLALKDGGS